MSNGGRGGFGGFGNGNGPNSNIMSNGGSTSPARPHSNSGDNFVFGAGFTSSAPSTSTHFASSGGNMPKAAKATELVDDFDFDFFEQVILRVLSLE